MEFIQSQENDLETIYHFYDLAVAFQKTKFHLHWKEFDHDLVLTEIKEGRQFKLLIEDKIAAIFAITFQDKSIWKEKSDEPAIYIHRIVTHPDFKGRHLVKDITNWSIDYAKKLRKEYVRMDTWGDNNKLIDYYQKCGFQFMGIITPDSAGLPKHYNNITLSLFEIKI